MPRKKKGRKGMNTQHDASPGPDQHPVSKTPNIPIESSGHISQDVETAAAGGLDKDAFEPKEQQPIRTEEQPGTPENRDEDLNSIVTKRPDYGTQGKKINLLVNYFPVELPDGKIYHYDVEILSSNRASQTAVATSHSEANTQPKKVPTLSKKRNRQVINTLIEKSVHFRNNRPAFDGQKNLYSSRPLLKTPLTELVELSDDLGSAGGSGNQPLRKYEFEVSIKPVRKKGKTDCAIDLRPLRDFFKGACNNVSKEAFMAVETILQSGPSFRYVPLGRAFFYPPVEAKDLHPLSGGREIWFGYRQHLLLAQTRTVLNVDITATTFHKSGPVIKYISEILNRSVNDLYVRELRDFEIAILTKKLKGLTVKSTHTGFKKRVIKVTREAANKLSFLIETNEGPVRKKVSDYFSEKYRALRFPHLPCLQVAPESRHVYLPLELCEVMPGQHANVKTLTETQSREMIKQTKQTPDVRFVKNQLALRNADFNNDLCCQNFGIRVSSDPLRVVGRVIDSPAVQYNKQCEKPRNGRWDMIKQQFFVAAKINCWLLLSIVDGKNCNRDKLQNFVRMLLKVANRCGINLQHPESINIYGEVDMKRSGVILKRAVQESKNKATLAVVVLPGRNVEHHKELKRVAEIELGIITQCVALTTLDNCRDDALTKLCQKINAKMGGVNNAWPISDNPKVFERPVIIIGADVNHSDINKPHQSSIAAVVGSLDSHPFRYAVTCRPQRHRDENKKALEVIRELKDMVVELLKAFYSHTHGRKPEKIIFYRDGVSDGQFLQVRKEEITAVKEACKSMSADYNPGLTFVVVQKRHHTRFFPVDGEGKPTKVNAPPGTVVDRTATSPVLFNFFIYSHYGHQGTSRPGLYTVLFDENKFTSDDLQKLTYYLCHIYARCTSSISIPVPVMYADQAAYRAREYLNAQNGGSSSGSDASDGDTQDLQTALIKAISVQRNLKNAMYFV